MKASAGSRVLMLLEYIWTGAQAQAPQLDSLRLCGQAIRWDLSLLRGDQVEALDAATSMPQSPPKTHTAPDPSWPPHGPSFDMRAAFFPFIGESAVVRIGERITGPPPELLT